jgi:hypothetical protein
VVKDERAGQSKIPAGRAESERWRGLGVDWDGSDPTRCSSSESDDLWITFVWMRGYRLVPR